MTHKQKVLALLSDHKPHSHHELYQLGCVAHSRISDLRKDGHLINSWREGDLYLYRLADLGALDEAATSPVEASRVPLSSPTVAASSSASVSNPPHVHTGNVAASDGRDGAGVLQLFGDAA
jgi:dipeptidyl aminopeptidase/acylaminoacyl peptidase